MFITIIHSLSYQPPSQTLTQPGFNACSESLGMRPLSCQGAESYILLLSLGRGHNVVRLDTRALGSLRHPARLKTSSAGQWLRYLAAVVSICEYTVSNKGGLPCHCHDWGRSIVRAMSPRLIFCEGNCPHCPPGSAAYVRSNCN